MGLGLGLGWDNGTQWDNGPIVEMRSHGTSWTLVGNTGQLSLFWVEPKSASGRVCSTHSSSENISFWI